jgi:XapX domain-containing protein
MRMYLVSLGAGILVGVIYSLLNVRSPAPPLVALVGLLGILIGEQVIPIGKQLLAGTSLAAACHDAKCVPHLFGELPGRNTQPSAATAQLTQSREIRS